MPIMIDGTGPAAGLRFAIVHSRFNETVTKGLLQAAVTALRTGGVKDDAIEIATVPGAFEIPLIAAKLAKSRRYHAVICIGAVIRGETPHFDYISTVVSQGIARVAYDYGLPVVFGVLTCDTEEQATARFNKGTEAAVTAIEMVNLIKRLPLEKRSAKRGHRNPRRQRPRRRIR